VGKYKVIISSEKYWCPIPVGLFIILTYPTERGEATKDNYQMKKEPCNQQHSTPTATTG
jgi:hypothetical protein